MKHKSKALAIIMLIIAAATAGIAFLTNSAHNLNNKKNGFIRVQKDYRVHLLYSLKIDMPVKDIAGLDTAGAYFYLYDPMKLLYVSFRNGKSRSIMLNVKQYVQKIGNQFTTHIEYPVFRILGNNTHVIVAGRLDDTSNVITQIEGPIFTKAIIINSTKAIMRQFAKKPVRDQVFVSFNPLTGRIQKSLSPIVVNNDGGIKTDGTFAYDRMTNTISYVYYYRNGFIIFDTALAVVGSCRTIDTLKSYVIKTGALKSHNETYFTNNSPTVIINKASCSQNGYLYIASTLKADNESDNLFQKNIPVDVYQLSTGTYSGSLYMPVANGQELISFRKTSDNIIALFNNQINIYHATSVSEN